MATKDMTEKFKKLASNTLDKAKKAVKDIDSDEMKKKLDSAVENTKKFAKTAYDETKKVTKTAFDETKKFAQNINVEEIKENMMKVVKGKEDKAEPVEQVPIYTKAVSFLTALKISYYLMAIDGEIFRTEEEKFDEICKAINPDFEDMKNKIVQECQKQIDKVKDTKDYYDSIKETIDKELNNTEPTKESFVVPNVLVWNLLTIAYSDKEYSNEEKELLKTIVNKTKVDDTLFLEMENSYATIVDIQKELEWIKTTDRPYLVIETQVKELEKRIKDIFESVRYLMTL